MRARDVPGPAAVVADIERRLREAGTPARAAAERVYLKSSMEFAGATVPDVRRIVRALLPRRPAMARDGLLAVVKPLPPDTAARMLAAYRARGRNPVRAR